jgi:hypothetical protein
VDHARALHGAEAPAFEVVGLERDSIAAFFRTNRERMTPQLATSLVILGYCRWGVEFLKLADL